MLRAPMTLTSFRSMLRSTHFPLLLLPLIALLAWAPGARASALVPVPQESEEPREGQEDEPPLPEFSILEKHAFLDDVSTWQQHLVQPEGQPVDKSVRGVFPIGDGHVFGYLGLGRRANTMQGLSGPSYQTAEVWAPKGHWGEMSFDLLEGNRTIALPSQRLWRTRGVNVVMTEDAVDDEGSLSLYTLNFATAGHRSVYRWVEVRNRGENARKLSLRVHWERGSNESGASSPMAGALQAKYAAKGFEARLRAFRPANADGHAMTIDLGEVPADGVVTVPLVLETKGAGQEYAGANDANKLLGALDECRRRWKSRLATTSTIASDRRKLADLVEDWKVLMLVQRSEPSGAVSPMVNYRGAWVRDSVGPTLAFLRYGLHSEAADLLRFLHDATLVTGELRNHFPLDLDLSTAESKRESFDASKIRIPNTELPGWIILQHAWYFRATWDIALIQRHMPLLRACMDAFQPDAKTSLPTHGDETYLHGALFSLFPARAASPNYFPADMPGRRARSLDNSLLYLMSIDAMSELVEELDKAAQGDAAQKRDWSSPKKQPWEKRKIDTLVKIEETFWLEEQGFFAPFLSPITGAPHTAPFGPVNLKIQWLGYTYAIGEKNRRNLKNTTRNLYHAASESGRVRVGSTPTVGHFPGALPGYLLYSLADLDDSRRNDALDELVHLAGPAGEWGELYDPEGRPIGSYSEEWPNRLRPWESGINIDAILFALNGARYVTVPGWSKKDQRLKLRIPNDSRWLTMKRMQHDGHTYNVYLDEVYERDKEIDSSGKPVRKMRFRVHYDVVNFTLMQTEFIDLAANVGETLYIRYPKVGSPVNETTVWPVDKEEMFLGSHVGAAKEFQPAAPAAMGSGKTLFLTSGSSSTPPQDSAVLDIGMPMLPQQLAELLMADGKPRYERLVFDVNVRDANRGTFKTGAFWNHPSLLGAQRQFRDGGGTIVTPRFLTRFQIVGPEAVRGLADLDEPAEVEKPEHFRGGEFDWKKKTISGTYLDLDVFTAREAPKLRGKSYACWASSVLVSKTAREAILKVGSDDGIRVWLNGKVVLSRAVKRTAAVDQDEVLIRLVEGENRLLFKVVNEDGSCGLYARVTAPNGLPVPGLSYR